jgi:hypothetical protein
MKGKYRQKLIFVFLLAFALPLYGSLQETNDTLIADFWYPVDFFLPNVFERLTENGYGNLSAEQFNALSASDAEFKEAAANILEEARFVFSGVLFGYRFVYRPYDRRRNVTEIFTLEPFHQIEAGDPNLKIIDTYKKDNAFYVRIRYRPDERTMALYKRRGFSDMQSAAGRGQASIFGAQPPIESKLNAIKESAKQAVRNHQRLRRKNKPLQISGEIFLTDAPRMLIEAAAFVAYGRFLFKISETEEYNIF